MLPLQIEMFYCLTLDIIIYIYNPEVKSSFNHGAHVPWVIFFFSLYWKELYIGPWKNIYFHEKGLFYPEDSFFIWKMMELD